MIEIIGTPTPNGCDVMENPAFIRFLECFAMMLRKYGHIVLNSPDIPEER